MNKSKKHAIKEFIVLFIYNSPVESSSTLLARF